MKQLKKRIRQKHSKHTAHKSLTQYARALFCTLFSATSCIIALLVLSGLVSFGQIQNASAQTIRGVKAPIRYENKDAQNYTLTVQCQHKSFQLKIKANAAGRQTFRDQLPCTISLKDQSLTFHGHETLSIRRAKLSLQ